MFFSYIRTAWRSLRRHKAFSIINVFGLTLGLTCSLLILLWVCDERSVDRWHTHSKQLWQVYERNYFDGKVGAGYATQGLLADELKRVVPEIQYSTGLERASGPGASNTISAGDKPGKVNGSFAGADFFRMFSFPLLEGSAGTALDRPGVIAVSHTLAVRFFGSPSAAIGRSLLFDNKENLMVSAVFEDIPANSSLQVAFLRSWTDFIRENPWANNWGNADPSTYLLLRPNADAAKVEAQIKDFLYRYEAKNPSSRDELALQPWADKYLHSTFRNGYIDGGRIEYVRIFTVVAVLILLIACINFMNLATAQAARRAREIGVRKVVGASRLSLAGQFIGEAFLLSFLSLAGAILLSSLLLPVFNDLTGKQLSLPVSRPLFWVALSGLLILTGFIAGSYPAFFLSSLDPVKMLKGGLKFSWKDVLARQGLVIFQFSLTILLIVGMIVIYRQLDYIQKTNIGYDRENLVYIPIEGELAKNYALFKEQARDLPGVLSVSRMRNTPTVIEHHTGSIGWPGKDPNSSFPIADEIVGYDLVKTLRLQLKEGRDFSRDYPTDSVGFLLNETAVGKMGLKDPIGHTLFWGNRQGKVIGVLKDFHFSSMHTPIDPLIVRLDENFSWGTILVRIGRGRTKEALEGLERLAKRQNPQFPFTYRFSDEEFNKLYKSEQLVSRLAGYFAFLGIFISCLGLFGLATFAIAQRTKEIGIRKVLGASVPGISFLLANNFLKIVVLAMLAAFPIAWLVMSKWLDGFVYRIRIEWWMFAVAGVTTLGVALLTVSYQSIRAALANPIRSLRTD
ncbi:MAG: ABC transporter permease [Bacteroidetes bacterium]|nr:ABC transporter permease [Bacteroidota bacterium]